jgi:hypothetical protein
MDYELLAVLSEYFIIRIISDTKSQIHWLGIEKRIHCKKKSNIHLSHGNAQKFGVVNYSTVQ